MAIGCDVDEATEYFEWLDGLRASGAVNMLGARPLLAEEFGLDRRLSAVVWSAWSKTFAKGVPAKERAVKACQE